MEGVELKRSKARSLMLASLEARRRRLFWCFGVIGASNDRDTALGRANRAGRWGAVAGPTGLEGPVSSFEELTV